MTEYRYEDRAGVIKQAEEVWQMGIVKTNARQCDKTQMFKMAVEQKEEEIKQKISSSGGTLLSINTLAISKRRYKRKLAKQLALARQANYRKESNKDGEE